MNFFQELFFPIVGMTIMSYTGVGSHESGESMFDAPTQAQIGLIQNVFAPSVLEVSSDRTMYSTRTSNFKLETLREYGGTTLNTTISPFVPILFMKPSTIEKKRVSFNLTKPSFSHRTSGFTFGYVENNEGESESEGESEGEGEGDVWSTKCKNIMLSTPALNSNGMVETTLTGECSTTIPEAKLQSITWSARVWFERVKDSESEEGTGDTFTSQDYKVTWNETWEADCVADTKWTAKVVITMEAFVISFIPDKESFLVRWEYKKSVPTVSTQELIRSCPESEEGRDR